MPGPMSWMVPENETVLSQAADKYLWSPMGQAMESPNVQALMDAMDQANRNIPPVPGVGYAKPIMAMIPTMAKLPKFLQLMKEAQAFKEAGKAAEKVASLYMHARYPKRAGKMMGETVFESNPIARALGQAGSFSRKAYEANTPSINLQTKGLFNDPEAKELVDTLTHEGQHYLDYNRAKTDQARAGIARVTGATTSPKRLSKVSVEEFIPEDEGGKYILFTKDKDAYRVQPVEARAFKGGATAKKGYDHFLSLFEDAYQKNKRKRPFSTQARIYSDKTIDQFSDAIWQAAKEKAATEPPGVSDTAIFLDEFEKAAKQAKTASEEARKYIKDRVQYDAIKDAYLKAKKELPFGSPVRAEAMKRYFDAKIPKKTKFTPRYASLLPASGKASGVLSPGDKWTPYYTKALENLGFTRYSNFSSPRSLSTIGGPSTEDAILSLLGK